MGSLCCSSEKDSSSLNTPLLRGFLNEVLLLVQHDFRVCFGAECAYQWGHFLDWYLSTQVYLFANWVSYPTGHFRFAPHCSLLTCSAVSTDGRYLFAGSEDGSIVALHLASQSKVGSWTAHQGRVTAMVYHSSDLLVSASETSSIRVWSIMDQCELTLMLNGHTDQVNDVILSRDESTVISASDDCTIREWCLDTAECLRRISGHTGMVSSLCRVSDGCSLISGSFDKTVREWDDHTGDELKSAELGIFVYDLDVNSEGSLLACVFLMQLRVFSLPSLDLVSTLQTSAFRVCFHPENPRVLAVGEHGGRNLVKLVDAPLECVVKELEGHSQEITNLCFTPDGSRLISTSNDRECRVWDVTYL